MPQNEAKCDDRFLTHVFGSSLSGALHQTGGIVDEPGTLRCALRGLRRYVGWAKWNGAAQSGCVLQGGGV